MTLTLGDILEDEAAIVTLKDSAVTSADIKEKQAAGAETEKEIDEVRTGYKPVAQSTQVLFFCIADLAAIESPSALKGAPVEDVASNIPSPNSALQPESASN